MEEILEMEMLGYENRATLLCISTKVEEVYLKKMLLSSHDSTSWAEYTSFKI
jgi:hypothetical protein